MKIEVGMILEVITDNFYASKNFGHSLNFDLKGRVPKIHLKKGEKIEIRFPFEWNYRTEDNIYFHSEPDYIIKNCKIFGKVLPDVKFKNMANLEEILRLELYTSSNPTQKLT